MSTLFPEAREVRRLDVLVTAADAVPPEVFLGLCQPGSGWLVRIRTAEVVGTVRLREALGTLDERLGTCVGLVLDRPVPVEPGLTIRMTHQRDASCSAVGVVRPWFAAQDRVAPGDSDRPEPSIWDVPGPNA